MTEDLLDELREKRRQFVQSVIEWINSMLSPGNGIRFTATMHIGGHTTLEVEKDSEGKLTAKWSDGLVQDKKFYENIGKVFRGESGDISYLPEFFLEVWVIATYEVEVEKKD